MDVVLLVGRILFVLLFISSGIGHIRNREMLAGYGAQMGMPAPNLLVPLTGVQLLVGSAMVLLGIWADAGALLIALFLLPTAFVMHAYWKIEDPEARHGDQIHFQKDIALLGAALITFVLFQQYGNDLGLMITGPLF
ncbi:MAG: DoxX family protein [Solirubrobacterales bacterium]|nr:DoxX family protein [Solirubrobacterales bacterium]